MNHEKAGLVIIAAVAILSIVGLAMSQASHTGGSFSMSICGQDASLQMVMNPEGGQAYYECVPKLTDVKYIPKQADQVGPNQGPIGQSFQTEYQRKERQRDIILRQHNR